MQAPARVVTFLFTDIEGSTRLWEERPAQMRPALARHDAVARAAVEQHGGVLVKMTGDGLHAAFEDPRDALIAALDLQLAISDPEQTGGIALCVRCGLHVGVDERRDNDFFGPSVNRAARIMSAAHGGQILVSQAVAALLKDRLPEGVTLRDLGAARLRDLASPEQLFQVAHAQLRSEFPPLRSLEAAPNNLPQQLTSFIGRERDLADAKRLLAKTRLLTLVGAGGIGKTRLSLQVAADVMDEFPDGVWFVELAPLTDARRVPQALALVLGVKEDPGRPVFDALLRYAKGRQLLIVLDNCEHLVSACVGLVRSLLEAAPGLKVLASSRENLRITGEQHYPVPPLSLPRADEPVAVESLAQFGAIRLFVERARAVQPAFAITDANFAAVTNVCRRLDGIPLAIELAAARASVMPVQEIAARLNDRFRLLVHGDRAALPRQQTLRALIDWSFELLSGQERALLRRLAVFAGGWTLDAAEAVGASGELRRSDILDLLSLLVEKSLAALDSGKGRYQLLDTVRQYAEERLDEANEKAETCTRHLTFYLDFAERAASELFGPRQSEWLARLDVERDNLLAAHRWCDKAPDGTKLGLRLVHALKQYWLNRGLLGLRYQLTVEALARTSTVDRSLARCRELFNAGQVCCFMGRYVEAGKYLTESLDIAREIGDESRIEMVLQLLGMASLGQGEVSAAHGYLDEALLLAKRLGEKREIAAATNALAQLHHVDGALESAAQLYESVLALAHELGDREIIAISLLNLSMVSISCGAGEQAAALLREVFGIAEQTGSMPASQSLLEISVGLAALHQEWERAARFYGAAEAQAQQTGLHRAPADEAFLNPVVAEARRALGEAGFAVAEREGSTLGHAQVMEEVHAWLLGRA